MHKQTKAEPRQDTDTDADRRTDFGIRSGWWVFLSLWLNTNAVGKNGLWWKTKHGLLFMSQTED